MEDVQIQLAALWTCLMLTYLLGDVLRLYSGDFKPGGPNKVELTKPMFLGIAVLMLIPILMILASVTLERSVNRWMNIGVAVFFFGFNLIGLPTYPSAYDRFLIFVSLVFNAITIGHAWNWD
jgi:hypothetical protein